MYSMLYMSGLKRKKCIPSSICQDSRGRNVFHPPYVRTQEEEMYSILHMSGLKRKICIPSSISQDSGGRNVFHPP
jgi:hypothetical protein